MSPEEVAAAFSQWRWISPDAVVTRTPGWTLVRNPDHFAERLEVVEIDPAGDPQTVVQEVLTAAAATGLPWVNVWLRMDTPEQYADLLAAAGGTAEETLDLLALELTAAAPDLQPSAGSELRWVRDLVTTRDAEDVQVSVFGGSLRDDEDLAEAAEDHAAALRAGEGGSLVAYLDGRPVGTGAVTYAAGPTGPVARLWGGAVLPEARRRGVYTDLLLARLRDAADRGATLALVRGRVDTSAPILRRAGFTVVGRERSVRVPLPPSWAVVPA